MSATPRNSSASTLGACRLKGGIFRPLGKNGPEHEAKEATVLVGELDIGETGPDQWIGASGRALHRRGKLMESLRGDRSKEIVLVGEMPIRGRGGYADAPGGLAQSDRLKPVLVQDLTGRGQQRGRQIPVAIGAGESIRFCLSAFTL